MISVFLIIWLEISKAEWNLTAMPWYCDRDCYKSINEIEISTDGCLKRNETTEHIFSMFDINASTPICHKRSNSRYSFCLKMINGKYFIGTCNVNVIDHRIRCRKVAERMSWYRGPQSVTFSGKSCLRWDEVDSNQFQPTDFTAHSGPSIKYASTRFTSGIHSMENYCRNPDNWVMGPWCYVMTETKSIQRAACFKQCENYAHREFCLSKILFPFMLSSSLAASDAPNVRTNSESIKDLSDILDTIRVARIKPEVRPMFIPTYFNDYVRNYPADISTRLRCYQTGPQTRIAGPWTYTDADEPFPDKRYWLMELLKKNGADRVDRERVYRGDGGPEYTRWTPCFLACEDTNVQCWPVSQRSPDRPRFPYYGPRSQTSKEVHCVSPFYAYELLLHRERKKKKLHKNETIYLKIFRNKVLYDSDKVPRLQNFFAYGKGSLMTSNRCFTLGDFLRGINENSRSIMAKQHPLYHHILSTGAGCFVEVEYLKKVEYQACFADCRCQRSVQEPPVTVSTVCILSGECQAKMISDQEDYFDMEEMEVLQNFTGIGDIKLSDGTKFAPVMLLVVAFLCFIAAIAAPFVPIVYLKHHYQTTTGKYIGKR